jgi:hypothetical protein
MPALVEHDVPGMKAGRWSHRVVSNNSTEACDRLVAWAPCHLCSRFC